MHPSCAFVVATALTISGHTPPRKPADDCTTFHSAKLLAGVPFREPLQRGLEFRLSVDGTISWSISVGPVGVKKP